MWQPVQTVRTMRFMRPSSGVRCGKRIEHQIAGKLLERRFRIAHRREREILLAVCRQIDRAFGGLIAERLRPDPVAAVAAMPEKRNCRHSSVNTVVVMVPPSGLADTVTPPMALPSDDLMVPLNSASAKAGTDMQDRGDGGEVGDDETAAHGVLHLSSRHRATSRLWQAAARRTAREWS